MKTNLFLTLLMLLSFSVGISAQGVTNKGAVITISSGTHFVIKNGNYLNQTNAATDDGRIDLAGILYVDGDFTNTAANNVFIGTTNNDGIVVFNGAGSQTIRTNLADMSNFIDFEAVTINSGSLTDLAAGSAVTTNGIFTVNGTFTSKTPLSDAASGSLITNSSISGTGDVNLERYFKVGKWMYISVPIAGQTSTPLIDAPYTGYVNPNFYTYNEASGNIDPENSNYSNWSNFTDTWTQVGAGANLTVGEGYTWNAYNANDVNITFSSATPSDIHSGDLNVTVTYTDNDDGGGTGYGNYYDGWNIVGNPFPSSIDWEQLVKTTSMDYTVYYWDGDAENYIYHIDGAGVPVQGGGQTLNTTGASKNIPAFQSFFVHMTNPLADDTQSPINESFTLANISQLHSNQIMYKNTEKEEYNFQFLKLRVDDNGLTDETLVRFIDGTVEGFNGKEDAFKMFPNNDVPMIYSLTTVSNEYPLAINTLPLSSVGTTIPLGFKTSEAGTFSISVSEFNFDAGTDVKLVDTELETETLLTEGTEYTFNFEGGESRDRFYLFKSAQSNEIEDEPIDDNIETGVNVWSSDNNVYISISSYDLIDAHIMIFDMLGRTVIDQQLNGAYNIVNVPGSSGTYFVKLRTKDGQVRTDKVFISK